MRWWKTTMVAAAILLGTGVTNKAGAAGPVPLGDKGECPEGTIEECVDIPIVETIDISIGGGVGIIISVNRIVGYSHECQRIELPPQAPTDKKPF